jgi:hypothetical protein
MGEEGSRSHYIYVYNATWRRKALPFLSGHGAKPNPSPAEGTAKGGLKIVYRKRGYISRMFDHPSRQNAATEALAGPQLE